MLTITYQKRFIKLAHIWFPDDDVIWGGTSSVADLLFIHGASTNKIPGAYLLNRQNTLIKDLSKPEDELFALLKKNVRYDIRRSKKDGVCIECYNSGQLLSNPMILEQTEYLYNKMFEDKYGKDKCVPFNKKLAEGYAVQNVLIISMAFFNGEPVGVDGTIADTHDARLWISAFDFRNPRYDSQFIGRAHKALEWETFLHCKADGILRYDMGGVNSFEEPNGIAKFKMELENEGRFSYYNHLLPLTITGRIALLLFRLKQKVF